MQSPVNISQSRTLGWQNCKGCLIKEKKERHLVRNMTFLGGLCTPPCQAGQTDTRTSSQYMLWLLLQLGLKEIQEHLQGAVPSEAVSWIPPFTALHAPSHPWPLLQLWETRGYFSTQLPSTTSFWASCPKTHHNQASWNEHLAAHTTHGGMFRDQRLQLYFNLFIHLSSVKHLSLLSLKRNGRFLFFIYKESTKNFFFMSLWPDPSLSSNKMHFCNSWGN